MKKQPPRMTLAERMQREAEGADPEVMQRFMDAHDGMTPIQWAVSLLPEDQRDALIKTFPQFAPPKKPPPAGSR